MTKGRELVSALIVLVIVLVALVNSGHRKDVYAYVIGVAAAIIVGVVVLPGAAYVWSRLTFNRRKILSALQEIVTAIGALGTPTAEQIERAQERNRTLLTAAQGVHEELLLADERLREIVEHNRQPNSAFPCGQWDDHKAVLGQYPTVFTYVEAAMVKIRHTNELSGLGTDAAATLSLNSAVQIETLVRSALDALEAAVRDASAIG
jgi:hypothetical protein